MTLLTKCVEKLRIKMNKDKWIKIMMSNLQRRNLTEKEEQEIYNNFSKEWDSQERELTDRQNTTVRNG